ncbi:D-galactarate dehydratase [Roseovarius arcticus]|uniref:D-galactarate dehydratase n=1 Tax=Roseovarius arcticus TaxID=2547404 RepID=UPI001485FB9C|nr:D-galactarate dehydratase [Roseovarius arcticus]
MKNLILISAATVVAGCAAAPDWLSPGRTPTPEAEPATITAPSTAPKVPPNARTVEQFDTTSAADKAAAAQPAAGGTALGTTIASLGAPGEPGFWLKTPLVKKPGPGRVVYPANGKSVKVDLIPLGGDAGAGSRMSLAALRVIEAPLTGLPEVQVFSLK